MYSFESNGRKFEIKVISEGVFRFRMAQNADFKNIAKHHNT